MEVVPDHVLDPSPHLYDTTLYGMSALLSVAVVCNALIGPIHPKHHIKVDNIHVKVDNIHIKVDNIWKSIICLQT